MQTHRWRFPVALGPRRHPGEPLRRGRLPGRSPTCCPAGGCRARASGAWRAAAWTHAWTPSSAPRGRGAGARERRPRAARGAGSITSCARSCRACAWCPRRRRPRAGRSPRPLRAASARRPPLPRRPRAQRAHRARARRLSRVLPPRRHGPRRPPPARARPRPCGGLMEGGFVSRSWLEDALLLAVLETGVPVWALDAERVDGPSGSAPPGRPSAWGRASWRRPAPGPDGRRRRRGPRRRPVRRRRRAKSRAHPTHHNLLLFAVAVDGVPDLHVEEAMFTCVDALGAGPDGE